MNKNLSQIDDSSINNTLSNKPHPSVSSIDVSN